MSSNDHKTLVDVSAALVAAGDELFVLPGDPAERLFGLLLLDVVGHAAEHPRGAAVVDGGDVLARHDRLVDEIGDGHEQDAARDAEEEAEPLVDPAEGRT